MIRWTFYRKFWSTSQGWCGYNYPSCKLPNRRNLSEYLSATASGTVRLGCFAGFSGKLPLSGMAERVGKLLCWNWATFQCWIHPVRTGLCSRLVRTTNRRSKKSRKWCGKTCPKNVELNWSPKSTSVYWNFTSLDRRRKLVTCMLNEAVEMRFPPSPMSISNPESCFPLQQQTMNKDKAVKESCALRWQLSASSTMFCRFLALISQTSPVYWVASNPLRESYREEDYKSKEQISRIFDTFWRFDSTIQWVNQNYSV